MILSVLLSCCAMQQLESAQQQFEFAKSQKSRCTGLSGIAKGTQKRAAADAYADVKRYWPIAHPYVEEACFRRAEILRSLEELGAARGCFEDVLELAAVDSDFYIRSLLELGHLCRRSKLYEQSLNHYARAAAHSKGSLSYQVAGQSWLAKLNYSIKEYAAAEEAALQWRERSLSSVDYIRASDLYLCAMARQRKWREAQQQLADLRKEMLKQSTAPSEEGEAVAKALAKLKAPKEIDLIRQGGR